MSTIKNETNKGKKSISDLTKSVKDYVMSWINQRKQQ